MSFRGEIMKKIPDIVFTYYRKHFRASYIVREVRSVRERDTERERKRDRRK